MAKPVNSKKPSGPAKIGGLEVTVDRDLCISAATCLAIAPGSFELDDEAKAIIIDENDSVTKEEILDAARACPTGAIIVKDANGKQLYP